MGSKTSQLQIRVSPQEKAALKRLAAGAGMSVSRYVLAHALPSSQREVARILGALPSAAPAGLRELATLLAETDAEGLAEVFASPPLEGFSPVLENQVAALVEHAAHTKGVAPPPWVDAVPPLTRPHFGWPLASLRPHQIRVTPVPFKRRAIFFDPASPRSVPVAHPRHARPERRVPEPLRRLHALDEALRGLELKLEFYYLGGALLSQSFHTRPRTVHVSALFGEPSSETEAVAALTQREAWPDDWLRRSIDEGVLHGAGAGGYLDLPNLAVFTPPLDYALAVKLASLQAPGHAKPLDDLRYLMRALNIDAPETALGIAERYFNERQLPPDARSILERLLAP